MNHEDELLLHEIYCDISCNEIESIFILFDDFAVGNYEEIKEALIGEYLVEGNEYYIKEENKK